ncbi:MAG: 5-(carboxyamino)imidazole ribonucleotide mutase [Candidatus Latescibacterota bacterium]|nr:MAG: 5-(carboxyamino)imidazole ribonucleotide mutase [Candidatus Latescibacterota bacterium]
MTSNTVVSVVMGSKSDEGHLEPAFKLLDGFGIDWETRVLSAHRQPDELRAYIQEADQKGVRVFIAAAGLSAALPGVIAAHTIKPVIGIPVPGGPLKGVDALLSIVQMPGGIPVATVGVGSHGPKNAAVLAAEILSLTDEGIRKKLEEYRNSMK